MNFDDILGKLMPLFEQKMAFNMEMGKRAMSLEEKKEASKTDIEYRKLESQITNEKDKLKWEKEKLSTAVKADYDLQALKNSGMLDTERLKGLNDKDLQEVKNAGIKDTEQYKANMEALPKILMAGAGQRIKNADGSETITPGSESAQNMAQSLGRKVGMSTSQQGSQPQARSAADEANYIQALEKNDPAGAVAYLNSLPQTQQGVVRNVLGIPPVAPAARAEPTVTAPEVKTPVATVLPVAQPIVNPSRPAVEPSVFQQAGAGARSVLSGIGQGYKTEGQANLAAGSNMAIAGQGIAEGVAGAGREFMAGLNPGEAAGKRPLNLAAPPINTFTPVARPKAQPIALTLTQEEQERKKAIAAARPKWFEANL